MSVYRTWEHVVQPETLAEALRLRAELGDEARVVAGGTDVVVELSRGVKPTTTLLDLSHVAELRGVADAGEFIVLGALATHNDVLASAVCRDHALPLAQACLEIGAPQLRARATVAGNIVTASPANDTISALVALDATVELASMSATRLVPMRDFHPGFRQTVLRPDELVTAIHVPKLGEGWRGMFAKLGLRQAQAISVIHFAIVIEQQEGVVTAARVAYGCLAPTVVRGAATEAALVGQSLTSEAIDRAAEAALTDVAPIADIRGSADYRLAVLQRLVRDALSRIAAGNERLAFSEVPILLETDATYPFSSWPMGNDSSIWLTVNGTEARWDPPAGEMTLLDALRHNGLTGAKEGCAEGECGACTVWLDGRAVMSCLVPAAQARGSVVTTIEGLADIESDSQGLHPLQSAFVDQGAVQCGFCIPGMVMAGAKLLQEREAPVDEEIQRALSGNICRCTGYRKILAAVRQASAGPS